MIGSVSVTNPSPGDGAARVRAARPGVRRGAPWHAPARPGPPTPSPARAAPLHAHALPPR